MSNKFLRGLYIHLIEPIIIPLIKASIMPAISIGAFLGYYYFFKWAFVQDSLLATTLLLIAFIAEYFIIVYYYKLLFKYHDFFFDENLTILLFFPSVLFVFIMMFLPYLILDILHMDRYIIFFTLICEVPILLAFPSIIKDMRSTN